MDNSIGRHFYKFLRKECCFKAFLLNAVYNNDVAFRLDYRNELEADGIIKFLDNHASIGSAFLWSETKEGHKYWEAKSHKWDSIWHSLIDE